jgi:hypothetical protein
MTGRTLFVPALSVNSPKSAKKLLQHSIVVIVTPVALDARLTAAVLTF